MIQWMLAIWSLVPLPFLNIACISQSSLFIYCWSLAWRIEHYLASMWNEFNCTGVWTFSGIVALVKLNKKKERTQIINIRNQRGGITTGPIDISSVAQSCPTLCDPMNCSTLGLPVHHQLLESTQTMSTESVVASNHLILCCSLLLLPSIFPSFRVFSNESTLCIRWPKYWSFSFNISPSNEHPGLVSLRMDWLDLLAVQGTLKSLLQHHSSKASVLRCLAFFIVQLSHPYMTTGKTIALTIDGPLLAK